MTRAVESTRRLVDELQPALIDIIGLFVAVSAHLQRECRRSGIDYSETVVGSAPEIDHTAALSVFRIAEEILRWFQDVGATVVFAHYEGEPEGLLMRFIAEGVSTLQPLNPSALAPRLAATALRASKLNGVVGSESRDGRIAIEVQIPGKAVHAAQDSLE